MKQIILVLFLVLLPALSFAEPYITLSGAGAKVQCVLINTYQIGIKVEGTAGDNPEIDNCTIVNCGVGVDSSIAYLMKNTIVWNNTDDLYGTAPTKTTCNVEDDSDADPLFVNATDFHLQSNSPCKWTGTPIVGLTRDYNNKLYNTSHPSMGILEFNKVNNFFNTLRFLIDPFRIHNPFSNN